jgi:bile acid:Na+ symporter, BASS family
MSFAQLALLLLNVSIKLIVFSLGLRTATRDATFHFRQPLVLLRSLVAMVVVMPVLAGVVVHALNLLPPVEVTLVVLSVSPVPPILPKREIAAGGLHSHAIGLLVATAVTSIVTVPAAVELFGWAFDQPHRIPATTIARIVGTTILLPLAAGMILRLVRPGFADRLANPISRTGSALLVAGIVPVLFFQGAALLSLIGNGTLMAMAVFAIAGMTAGFLMGGPEWTSRIVLSLSTTLRHPGVAMTIASANFPDQKLVLPAILLYMIVSLLVSSAFLAVASQRHKKAIGGRAQQSSTLP